MRPAKISVGCFSRFLRGKTSPQSFVPIREGSGDVYLLPCSRQLARNKRSHPAETSRSKQKLDSVLIWMTYTVQFLGALIGRIVDNLSERNVSEKIQKRERYICVFEKEKKPGERNDEGEKGSGTLAHETIGHLIWEIFICMSYMLCKTCWNFVNILTKHFLWLYICIYILIKFETSLKMYIEMAGYLL